jgi:hypothetical protein
MIIGRGEHVIVVEAEAAGYMFYTCSIEMLRVRVVSQNCCPREWYRR